MRIWIVKGAVPVAVSLAVVAVVTAVLWQIRMSAVGPQHLIFFYLLPVAFLAVLYGRFAAMLCAVAGAASAAYFLYDPLYSFYIASPLEMGELVFFAALASLGAKCAVDLLRPAAKFAQQNPVTKD